MRPNTERQHTHDTTRYDMTRHETHFHGEVDVRAGADLFGEELLDEVLLLAVEFLHTGESTGDDTAQHERGSAAHTLFKIFSPKRTTPWCISRRSKPIAIK